MPCYEDKNDENETIIVEAILSKAHQNKPDCRDWSNYDLKGIIIEAFSILENKFDAQQYMLQQLLQQLKLPKVDSIDFEEDFGMKIPANSKHELHQLNELLDKNEKKQILYNNLSLAGGSNIRLVTSRVINLLMTVKCLSEICWKGGSNIEKPGMVTSFKNIFNIIMLVIKSKSKNSEDVGSVVENCLKNKFRNSNSIVNAKAKKTNSKNIVRNLKQIEMTQVE